MEICEKYFAHFFYFTNSMEIDEIFANILTVMSTHSVLVSMQLGSKNSISMNIQNPNYKKIAKQNLREYVNHASIIIYILSIYMYMSYGVGGMILSIATNITILIWIYNQYYEIINI